LSFATPSACEYVPDFIYLVFLASCGLDHQKSPELIDLALKLQAQRDLPNVQYPKPYSPVRHGVALAQNPIVCEVSGAEPDFRLLRGDLGDPNACSTALTVIEKLFDSQKNQLASDIILLLGPSGCGMHYFYHIFLSLIDYTIKAKQKLALI